MGVEQLRRRVSYDSASPWQGSVTTDEEMASIEQALKHTRERMEARGFYSANQVLGRRETIGCVALEITQRCNLDCTLCYLSENSESVKDLPLPAVYERIDRIASDYGAGTAVQITGGDPTMRYRPELVAIVERCRKKGLVPALFTNGIKVSRDLLEELASVGLADVAFHVDLTQERKGYRTEKELNAIRREYIECARGLPITLIFNTTVFDGNFHEIPDLCRFFIEHSDVINMVSFQMQADTGRGELRKRGPVITLQTVREQINKGSSHDLAWDTILFGHHECNRYAPTFVVGDKVFNIIGDDKLFSDFLETFKHVLIDRRDGIFRIAWPFAKIGIRHPSWLIRGLKWAVQHLWQAKWDLVKNRGRFNRMSFFIHNFMDADNLECERIDTCSFMVMTDEGPMSMCAHNAKRDEYILRPINVKKDDGTSEEWDPRGREIKDPERQIADAYQGVPTSKSTQQKEVSSHAL